MYHVVFNKSKGPYKVAFLIKRPALVERELEKHYLDGLDLDSCIGFSLDYGGKKKPSATIVKDYLNDSLLPAISSLGITTLYCADSEYFKKLTKQSKAEPHLGYVLSCAIDGYEDISVIYGVNYQSLFYNPDNQTKLDLSLTTLRNHLDGSYKAIGTSIIHSESYPETFSEIEKALASLHAHDVLSCDTETFSLKFHESGVGSIGFAWSENDGLAFCCDYVDATKLHKMVQLIDPNDSEVQPDPGMFEENRAVRDLLKKFFTEYKGKLIWHNMGFDGKILVYNLWMDDLLDYEGMLEGIEVMTRHFDDTKLLTYLATNSCAGNKLSLKDQAHEFAGNYAESDINNIRLIPKATLLRYNLVDCLSTWYVYNKHNSNVDNDSQRGIYDKVFIPAVKQILQMELVGMPVHMPSVIKADSELTLLEIKYTDVIKSHPLTKKAILNLRKRKREKDYQDRKGKAKNPDKIEYKDLKAITVDFNPASGQQVGVLLYDVMGLPIMDTTDTGLPATGAKDIEKLKNHTQDVSQIDLIEALVQLSKVGKILAAFIPNLLGATPVSDGTHRLYGGFNLGGTKSGRLSSSKPNLQQIPSGSTFAKLIKKCFRAPPGWLFVGADYNSLEDYVSALTTRDPMKMKVYEDSYDGHCLRAYSYFQDKMPDITQAVAGERCFKVEQDGKVISIKAGTMVMCPDNIKRTIEDYYEL